jgi:hypothetical protein
VGEGWETAGRRHLVVSREAAMTALERLSGAVEVGMREFQGVSIGGVMRRSSALGAAPR